MKTVTKIFIPSFIFTMYDVKLWYNKKYTLVGLLGRMMNPSVIAVTALFWFSFAGCSGDKPQCAADDDCPSGRYCRAGECGYDCTVDLDCPEDFRCSTRGKCERGCRKTNSGIEACDEVDNDCDGQTDETWPELGQPCANGTCPEGHWVCTEDGFGVECDGQIPLPDDSSCDGIDSDCDGQTDEDALEHQCPLQEGVCSGAMTRCLPTGQWSECDYGQDYSENDSSCNGVDNDCDGETDEDAAMIMQPETGSEATDGLDNNCNGVVDEPGGLMVRIDDTFAIDLFESTIFQNNDCSGERYGESRDDYPSEFSPDSPSISLFACSIRGVKPSGYLSWYRAKSACEAQGKRLCTVNEYSKACMGPSLYRFPYGAAFVTGVCNDANVQNAQKADTGQFQDCKSEYGPFDMSGNLAEWVEDTDGDNPLNAFVGGGYYECYLCDPYGYCHVCDPESDNDTYGVLNMSDCFPGSQSQAEMYESFEKTHPMELLGARCCMDIP